ncbi:PH domain-containing protein [Cellulomonas fimi]|uniref:Membrane-flanked domain protein n=1 Tax=Cellulomonas fimi (strain ATCC 484 / DSM 20113 / JCM 1341 / CCUG 24087 / LMG 16345 / NBRC 15513 / NCIMB 8980 / NCTC 7547 / NRS-133) TaxID=590998 RepID=F4GZ74_CELFA|nr:PH domain-containing protein [Cellulomonas fimi]AEE47190.1 membrane-flanked domain protein [Cellulomonas fimi ATCC 484]NNH08879.1 PH domain-containing protein [Cellulomonas fimi]VEH35536.1 Bacterial membrane flanked domain [Cellulomonas fimi]
MTTPEAVAREHRNIRRYVLPGERVVLSARSHWGKLAEPVLTTFAGFLLLAFVVVPAAGAVAGDAADHLWWLFAVLLVRLGWKVLDWRNEWFVATDKRMLLLYGLVTHKVAMMPLVKITDMRYSRSIPGRILGYGEFLLESAGQDQAMRRINWVARPDATYRELCATIFTPATLPTAPGTRLPVPGMLPGYGAPVAAPVHGPVPPPVAAPATPWPPVPGGTTERPPAYRPGDTQPIRIPPVRADERGWDVSGDRARFVSVEDQEAHDRLYDD